MAPRERFELPRERAHAISSRALPGYAISALVPPKPVRRLTITLRKGEMEAAERKDSKGRTTAYHHGRDIGFGG